MRLHFFFYFFNEFAGLKLFFLPFLIQIFFDKIKKIKNFVIEIFKKKKTLVQLFL